MFITDEERERKKKLDDERMLKAKKDREQAQLRKKKDTERKAKKIKDQEKKEQQILESEEERERRRREMNGEGSAESASEAREVPKLNRGFAFGGSGWGGYSSSKTKKNSAPQSQPGEYVKGESVQEKREILPSTLRRPF